MMYKIGYYPHGHIKYSPEFKHIDINKFREFVNIDDSIVWVEDIDESIKEWQIQQKGHPYRTSAFYDFNHKAGFGYKMKLSFDEDHGVIYCMEVDNLDECLDAMKDIADFIGCNIYKNRKIIYLYSPQ